MAEIKTPTNGQQTRGISKFTIGLLVFALIAQIYIGIESRRSNAELRAAMLNYIKAVEGVK